MSNNSSNNSNMNNMNNIRVAENFNTESRARQSASRRRRIIAACILGSVLSGAGAVAALSRTDHPTPVVTSPESGVQRYTVDSDVAAGTITVDDITAVSTVTKSHPVALNIPKCKEEDSHNCIWIADEQGNKVGHSFIDYKGHVYYIDRDMDY